MNNAIQERRSVRKFRADMPVTRQQLDKLLEAAMLAPSANNKRPWEFIAITNRDILDEIARVHSSAKMCKTAAAAIVVVALPRGNSEEYFPQDCGAATQNILLEAVNLGLGTCWCGVYPNEGRIKTMSELLNIPSPKIPFNVIALGVPDETPKQLGRFESSKISYFE